MLEHEQTQQAQAEQLAMSEKGFRRPIYAELLERQEERARKLLGADIDTSEQGVLGKFIRLTVFDLAQAYEDLEGVYYSRFPHYATGIHLDRLMPFAGISRNPAVHARHQVEMAIVRDFEEGGQDTELLPEGFRMQSPRGVTFETEEGHEIPVVYLDENGDCVDSKGNPLETQPPPVTVVELCCTEPGPVGNLQAGSITIPADLDAPEGLRVEHTRILMPGRGEETDHELRARFDTAIRGAGSGTLAAVKSALLRLPGVVGVSLVENDGLQTTDRTPPHTFRPYVLQDGSVHPDEIAQAIFDCKPLGIRCYGGEIIRFFGADGKPLDPSKIHDGVEYTRKVELPEGTQKGVARDKDGKEHQVYFSQVKQLEIEVRGRVEVTGEFPESIRNGSQPSDLLRKTLFDHINMLSNGDDLVYKRLFPALYQVKGVADIPELEVRLKGGDWGQRNIAIDVDQVARIGLEQIWIQTTEYRDLN